MIVSLFACCCRSVAQSHLTLCDPMDQHTRLPCPSSSPRVCSKSCPLSWWYRPTSSFSVIPFSSCLQSFPAPGSFPTSQLLHQVAKVLELQLQHQSFQWIFSVDFLFALAAEEVRSRPAADSSQGSDKSFQDKLTLSGFYLTFLSRFFCCLELQAWVISWNEVVYIF